MKAEVSLVDRTDGLGAVITEKSYQQLCHHELVGARRMKYEYHTQSNDVSTIRF